MVRTFARLCWGVCGRERTCWADKCPSFIADRLRTEEEAMVQFFALEVLLTLGRGCESLRNDEPESSGENRLVMSKRNTLKQKGPNTVAVLCYRCATFACVFN